MPKHRKRRIMLSIVSIVLFVVLSAQLSDRYLRFIFAILYCLFIEYGMTHLKTSTHFFVTVHIKKNVLN